MDRAQRRSTDVDATMTATSRDAVEAPTSWQRFEALYRSSRDDVYAYVATLLREPAAAEDVTALAFERAYRRRRSFDRARGNERAWLFGIARNAALDELRRRKRHATLAVDPEDPAAADAFASEDHADGTLRRTMVKDALDALPPRERELISLKFHAGLTNAEIARVLGVSESNAGTLLHRTIAKLRKACHDAA
jgi:RNA polymerase sigma-70 factor (ECF subfamily)